MCYPKPGPRCSNHALKLLKKATAVHKEAIASKNVDRAVAAKEELEKAQEEFYMTPKGQEYLKARIVQTGDPEGTLEYKLEYGKMAREEAIEAIKATDKGDVTDNHVGPLEARQNRLDRKYAEKIAIEKEKLDTENAVRKAKGLRPVSAFQNLSIDTPKAGYASYDASLIPQAPDLEKISSVVDAVGNGANTSSALGESFAMTSRDGSYYANGAEYIGLVKKSESMDGVNEFELTENGETFRSASANERAKMLRTLVNATPLMEAYAESGKNREKLEEYIRDSGYESSVAKRRASSLITWDKKLNSNSFVKELGDSSDLVSKLSVAAAAKSREERSNRLRKLNAVRDFGTCGECFTKLPASGVCGNCE